MFDTRLFWDRFISITVVFAFLFIFLDWILIRKILKKPSKQSLITNLVVIGWFLVILVHIYSTLGTFIFFQTILDKMLGISVLALATTGIVLIFKTSITTNFAQGMLATFGVYVSGIVSMRYAQSLGLTSPIAIAFIAMFAGAVVAFLMGVFIDVFILRKAKYITSVGKQMITMGLVLVISGIIPVIFGIDFISAPRISTKIIPVEFLGFSFSTTEHAVIGMALTIIILVLLFSALRFTKWGLGVRATASNYIVAAMMGVNTKLITAFSWGIAGALGGVAAYLLAEGGNLTVGMMVSTQVNGFMASILGGFSSFLGPIVGAIMIPLLANLLFYFSPLWQNAIVYAVILLIVLAKPLGLFGKRIAKKV